MRRLALISDIHGNEVALDAVLDDIANQGVDAIYCLGDVVGYGPRPVECMRKVVRVCAPGKTIAGNHDHAAVHEPIGFNPRARLAAQWTKKQIKPSWWQFGEKRRNWNWLRNLPTSFTEGKALFVHASPRDHMEEYVLEEHTRGISLMGEDPEQLLNENFSLFEGVCFIGHTHRPGVITETDHEWHGLEDIDYRWRIEGQKALINIGSVGQPRDKDPRCSYVLYDGDEVIWRRVPYDLDKVCEQFAGIDMLDDSLGERLREGR